MTERDRANALRDAVCQIWSATGKYAHEIPALAQAAIQRDNEALDALAAHEAATPCPNGVHEWSNQFGDDWTPDVGTPCDCRQRTWGQISDAKPAHEAATIKVKNAENEDQDNSDDRYAFPISDDRSSDAGSQRDGRIIAGASGTHARHDESERVEFGIRPLRDPTAPRLQPCDVTGVANTAIATEIIAHEAATPMDLTNHHNALTCPHCNPKGLKLAHEAATPTAQTRYGGSCGTTPFYVMLGQCEPEYDQGHHVIVWYDDLYDLNRRASAEAAPVERPELFAELVAALKAVAETGDDCPMCDRGRLRNPQKTHWPECPFGRAQALLTRIAPAIPPSTERTQ